jgi:hypothetical protein
VAEPMIGVKIDGKDLMLLLKNTVDYTQSFLTEVKKQEPRITEKVANLSVEVFYEYLDGLARSHPGMLHHVYEWGQVGDPFARLYSLKNSLSRNSSTITAEFLDSQQAASESGQIFYDKASIMEEGVPVVVSEKDAKVLFFEIDGEEFFRHGPIYIANPGGSSTRGSFVKAFNEFYSSYFHLQYLTSIKFYEHFENPKDFLSNFKSAVKSRSGAKSRGQKSVLSWIERMPGGDL